MGPYITEGFNFSLTNKKDLFYNQGNKLFVSLAKYLANLTI